MRSAAPTPRYCASSNSENPDRSPRHIAYRIQTLNIKEI